MTRILSEKILKCKQWIDQSSNLFVYSHIFIFSNDVNAIIDSDYAYSRVPVFCSNQSCQRPKLHSMLWLVPFCLPALATVTTTSNEVKITTHTFYFDLPSIGKPQELPARATRPAISVFPLMPGHCLALFEVPWRARTREHSQCETMQIKGGIVSYKAGEVGRKKATRIFSELRVAVASVEGACIQALADVLAVWSAYKVCRGHHQRDPA